MSNTLPDVRVETATPPMAERSRHSFVEDCYGIATGCALVVVGILLLKAAGLITGGTAGLALLLSYLIPLPVGVLFTLGNIPFLLLAFGVFGFRAGVKVTIVKVCVTVLLLDGRDAVRFAAVAPAFSAVVGGTVTGMGVLALARHQAGVGGTGIVSLWLSRRHGWNMGSIQGALDCVILACAIGVVSWDKWLWSVASAASISLALFVWHRPGRYFAA